MRIQLGRCLRARVISAALIVSWLVLPARGDVVIVSNRTDQEIGFTIDSAIGSANGGEAASREWKLSAGDLVPVPCLGSVVIEYDGTAGGEQFELAPNSVYVFHATEAGELALSEVQLAPSRDGADEASQIPSDSTVAHEPVEPPAEPGTLTVKILVDEEEPSVQRLWEARLRKRVEAVSKILERQCFMKLEVVAVEKWDSDDALTEFSKSLAEFETEVRPEPAQIAIGFTRQYQIVQGKTNMGGTRGPFHPHILLREWAQQNTSPELMELLLHEIGHHLGAVHSPEFDSAMRTELGDGRAISRQFRVGFDPLNALALNLVGEQIRGRGVRRFAEFSPATRSRLADVYRTLGEALPEDPAAKHYLALSTDKRASPAVSPDRPPASPEGEAVRTVLAAIVAASPLSQSAAAEPSGAPLNLEPGETSRPPAAIERPPSTQLSRDQLFERYVRAAAAAAAGLPEEHRARAFALGLAIGLDKSDTIRDQPLVGALWQSIENDDERKRRLSVLGAPTIRGRYDLVQHFVVSGALTAILGPALAESIGLGKEISDADGGSGFSFVDYAADLAGIELVRRAADDPQALSRAAESFTIATHFPDATGLVEKLGIEEFNAQFGGLADARFSAARDEIVRRIAALEGYAE